MFNVQEKNYFKKVQAVLTILIFLLGSIGIVVSPTAKAENFNKSQLAERIMANRKEQSKDNKVLIAKLKKSKKKTKQKTKLVKEATKAAKNHPVNKSFRKYGISEVDLQLAQRIQLTAVGDSVMAGSSNDLKRLMPKAIINAAVSRQLNVAFDLLNNYQKQGVLADNVLIGLGTNGPFSTDDFDRLMHQVGPKRHVFWINTHVPTKQWQGQVNNQLEQGTKRFHNLTIIDWYGYSKKHPNWFYQDETHPTPVGSKHYSTFVVKTIVKHAKY